MKRKQIIAMLLTGIIVLSNSTVIKAHPMAGTTKSISETIKGAMEGPIIVGAEKVYYNMYTTTRVNVREHNNIDSNIIRTLGIAEEVSVFETEDGWSKTEEGWIKSEYLSKDKPTDKLLVTQDERYWLYQLIEAEAGGESKECRAWICSTVFNLMKLDSTPNNVIDMIFYKNTYSPTLDGRIRTVVPKQSTKEVVDSILKNGVCTNALFFEADYCNSSWHSTRTRLRQIDHTIFYK